MYFFKLLPLSTICLLALTTLAEEEPQPPTPFRAVAFSNDGKLLAAGYGERESPGGLIVWNVGDQRVVRQLKAALGISTLAFSPDARLLAFTRYDQPPNVLDMATGEVIWELPEPCRGGVAFSPDGKLLACSGTDKGIHLFDTESRKEIRVIEGAAERASGKMCFSLDGAFLLAPCGSAGAYLWDLTTGKPLQQVHHGRSYVRSAEFSPDGAWIITAGYDATARIWNAKTGELRARLSRVAGSALAISHDASTLVITGENSISLFELWLSPPTPEDIQRAQERLTALESDSYTKRQSASESLVALGFRVESILKEAADHAPDAEVRIRARLARQRILSEPTAELRGHTSEVSAVCISPDSEMIASASDDGTVRLWDLKSRRQIALLGIQ